ncbi:MAG: lytic transglycosylase domain-containing protein, partial [Hydrogenophaga sp.]
MNRMRWIRVFTAIMAALALAGPALAQTPAESALLEMREAFRRNQTDRLTQLLAQVRGHPLEPLALYWTMRRQLETAAPEDIRATLERMAGSYWEDRLRNDWLRVLGKRGDWARFEAER